MYGQKALKYTATQTDSAIGLQQIVYLKPNTAYKMSMTVTSDNTFTYYVSMEGATQYQVTSSVSACEKREISHIITTKADTTKTPFIITLAGNANICIDNIKLT